LRDWDDMRLFLALARTESLGRAGASLRLDPATISRRIARLEGALDKRLFTRSHQGYALTEEGARLLPHAIAAEAAMTAATHEAAEAQSGLAGQIRIGAPDGCANYLLPQVVARIFARTIPAWMCRSSPCPASSTCRGARRIWPSASRPRRPGG